MAVPIGGKILLDTNVLIDYLRAGLHAEWVLGGSGKGIRFISAIVLLELRLGADTRKRQRAVDRLLAFQPERVLGLPPTVINQAGQVFRSLYGQAVGMKDRLGSINDILIALAATHIGAVVVTGNLLEFRRIATKVQGLHLLPP